MNIKIVLRILGILLMGFSLTMLPPIVFSFIFADGQAHAFIEAMLFYITLGVLIWYPLRNVRTELRIRDGFLVVSTFWVVIG